MLGPPRGSSLRRWEGVCGHVTMFIKCKCKMMFRGSLKDRCGMPSVGATNRGPIRYSVFILCLHVRYDLLQLKNTIWQQT